MATYKSSSQANHGSGTNILTVTAPAGIADGDMLVFCAYIGGGTLTWPPGWTVVYGSGADAFRGGYKVASGESGDYTWTSNAVAAALGFILCYSGLDISVQEFATGAPASDSTTAFVSASNAPFAIYAWISDNAIDTPVADALTTSRISGGSAAALFGVVADETLVTSSVPSRTATLMDVAVTKLSQVMTFGVTISPVDVLSTVATLDHDVIIGVASDQHHARLHPLAGENHTGGFYVETSGAPEITDGDFVVPAPADGMVAMTDQTVSYKLIWVRGNGGWTAVEVTT